MTLFAGLSARAAGAAIAVIVAAGLEVRTEPAPVDAAARHHRRGVEFHAQRRLDEASREYARALALDPARAPSPRELEIIRRFAPRLHVTPAEPFSLEDVAAVLHPTERLIAYHLFWDDDIDFPDDNDPCDHEVVWVGFGADARSIERVWTYFHGRILEGGPAAVHDARSHAMRPRIDVQWGKHGSMPVGWQTLPIVAEAGDIERAYLPAGAITLADYNRATWRKLRDQGRRQLGHPLARRLGWPERFDGAWDAFVDFSRVVEPLTLIDRVKLAAVSRWNSAVINQQMLGYNFRPKTEWPHDMPLAAPIDPAESWTITDFQLPPKQIFAREMPRYPNVWFHVDVSLVSSYHDAVRLVADQIRGPMRLRELYGPFSNPEGADFEVRLEHLQPWEVAEHRSQQHAHAFHMRYYHSALSAAGLDRVTLPTRAGARDFYRVAASAHYEVEHANPNHADVEACPICGRTGEYQHLRGNLVEAVHDPLGVELLLSGTIRNEIVRFEDDEQPLPALGGMRDRLAIQHQVFPAMTGDRNTLRIGAVVLMPSGGR